MKTLLSLLFALGLVFGVSCRRDQDSTASVTPTAIPETVRMGFLPTVASVGLALAEQRSAKGGAVLLKGTQFANTNDMLNALVAGQLDFLPQLSSIPVFHLELQHPGTVRVFSHSALRSSEPFDRILVRKDNATINSLQDLAGKKVGVFPGTTATNVLKAFLKKKGIDSSAITFVPLAPPVQLAGLMSGGVDALLAYEPLPTIAIETEAVKAIYGSVFSELLENTPVGLGVISRSYERAHPQAAKQAVALMDDAHRIVAERPSEALPVLGGLLSVPEALRPKMHLTPMTQSNAIDVAQLQKWINLMVEIGELPRPISAQALTAATEP